MEQVCIQLHYNFTHATIECGKCGDETEVPFNLNEGDIWECGCGAINEIVDTVNQLF